MSYFLWSLIPFYLYVFIKNNKGMHALQQNAYNTSNRYLKWILKNPEKTIVTIDFLTILILPLAFLYLKLFMWILEAFSLVLFLDFF